MGEKVSPLDIGPDGPKGELNWQHDRWGGGSVLERPIDREMNEAQAKKRVREFREAVGLSASAKDDRLDHFVRANPRLYSTSPEPPVPDKVDDWPEDFLAESPDSARRDEDDTVI